MSTGDRKQGLDRGKEAERAAEADAEAAANEQAQDFRMRVMARRWVQRKAARGASPTGAIPKAATPLPNDVRARMEPQLGADLSGVKIGTDATSATAADQLGARAFTVAGEVHFGAGEFAPGSKEGDRLLAHELTHVVQGQRSGIQRKEVDSDSDAHAGEQQGHEVSEPGEPAEQEADAVADGVVDKLHGDKKGSKKKGDKGKDKDGEKEASAAEHGAETEAAESGSAHGVPKQSAPAVAAKLSPSGGRKIHLSRSPAAPAVLGSGIKIYRAAATASPSESVASGRIYRSGNGPAPDAALHEKAGAGNLKEAPVKSHDGKKDTGLVNVGGKSMAANPTFEKDAFAFEDKLGAKAWAHPVAQAAAADMAKKAKAYIQERVGGKWDAASGELASLCKEIGSENPGWSGAAGKAVKDVMAVFDEGNLAERMNHVGEFFIKIMGKDLVETDAKDLEKRLADAKMNVAGLMKRRTEMMEKQKARGGKPNNWDIAPTPPDSAAAGQWHARADRADVAGVPRDDKKGRSKVAQSDRKAGQTGADLSPREEALHKKEQPDWSKDKDTVKWEEGTKVWIINERDKWVQLQRSLSLPLGAGPSGTTNMLMQAAQALKAEPYSARLACIGYLLPAHHHTLVEIMAAAAPHGCDYNPGQQMYRNIKPLSEADLRACGKENKFPDETSGDDHSVADKSGEKPKGHA